MGGTTSAASTQGDRWIEMLARVCGDYLCTEADVKCTAKESVGWVAVLHGMKQEGTLCVVAQGANIFAADIMVLPMRTACYWSGRAS